MSKEEKNAVTLDDLAQMVAGGFVELRQEMHDGFARADGRIDQLEAKMDRGFAKTDQHFTEVEDRLLTLERITAKTANAVADLQEEVSAMNTALEKDTRQIMSHERRITTLEAVA